MWADLLLWSKCWKLEKYLIAGSDRQKIFFEFACAIKDAFLARHRCKGNIMEEANVFLCRLNWLHTPPIPPPISYQLLEAGDTTEFLIYTERRKTQKEVRMVGGGEGGGCKLLSRQPKIAWSSSNIFPFTIEHTMIRSKDGIDGLFFFPYLCGHK